MVKNKKQKAFQKKRTAIPKAVIVTGKILQFFSSEICVRYCARLFTTPIRYKTPIKEQVMLQNTDKKNLHVRSIDKNIQVYSYGNSSKKILLVHGWSGRGTQLYKIADAFVAQGYQVISFDGPAHGKSSGKTTIMPEFIKAIHAIDTKYGPFEAAIGHSFGGMALLKAKKENASFQKIITIGIADLISDITRNFIKNMELKPSMATKLEQHFDKKYQLSLESYSSSISAKEVEIPVLVVHDSDDFDVSVSCAYSTRQNLRNSELLITNGLGHRRILRNEHVIQRIISFIKNK